jgi:hypothetical protein
MFTVGATLYIDNTTVVNIAPFLVKSVYKRVLKQHIISKIIVYKVRVVKKKIHGWFKSNAR